MRFYRATSFIFPRHYTARIFTISIGAVHIPLITYLVLEAIRGHWDWPTFTVLLLATMFRALVMECLDPLFLRGQGVRPGLIQGMFLGLVVINLTAGFQTLGTLMAVGLMMLPATAARFWSKRLEGLMGLAIAIAMLASTGGLLISYHLDMPSGPSIILLAGIVYLLSALFGRYNSLFARLRRRAAPLDAPRNGTSSA